MSATKKMSSAAVESGRKRGDDPLNLKTKPYGFYFFMATVLLGFIAMILGLLVM